MNSKKTLANIVTSSFLAGSLLVNPGCSQNNRAEKTRIGKDKETASQSQKVTLEDYIGEWDLIRIQKYGRSESIRSDKDNKPFMSIQKDKIIMEDSNCNDVSIGRIGYVKTLSDRLILIGISSPEKSRLEEDDSVNLGLVNLLDRDLIWFTSASSIGYSELDEYVRELDREAIKELFYDETVIAERNKKIISSPENMNYYLGRWRPIKSYIDGKLLFDRNKKDKDSEFVEDLEILRDRIYVGESKTKITQFNQANKKRISFLIRQSEEDISGRATIRKNKKNRITLRYDFDKNNFNKNNEELLLERVKYE